MSLSLTSRSILVIDDDEIMRELLSAILAMDGYTVTTVSSGADGVAAMQQAALAFDVVLADLHMPGLAGAELARQLNENRVPPTTLLGMSGREPTQTERALFDAFLVKPFDMEAFMETVEHVEAARTAMKHVPLPKAAGKPLETPALNEATYNNLAAMLPAAKLQELYSVAMLDVERRVATMRTAAERKDVDECRRQAHAIKGSCGMVGAAELSALAARIETGAFESTPPLEDFTLACSRLRRILDARFTTPK